MEDQSIGLLAQGAQHRLHVAQYFFQALQGVADLAAVAAGGAAAGPSGPVRPDGAAAGEAMARKLLAEAGPGFFDWRE